MLKPKKSRNFWGEFPFRHMKKFQKSAEKIGHLVSPYSTQFFFIIIRVYCKIWDVFKKLNLPSLGDDANEAISYAISTYRKRSQRISDTGPSYGKENMTLVFFFRPYIMISEQREIGVQAHITTNYLPGIVSCTSTCHHQQPISSLLGPLGAAVALMI